MDETNGSQRFHPGFDRAEEDLMRAWKSIDQVRYDIARVEHWGEYDIRSAQVLVERATRALRDLRGKVKLVAPPEDASANILPTSRNHAAMQNVTSAV